MAMASTSTSKYRYTTEIAAMCVVFSGTKPEEEVVQFIEDTVRNQIGDLVVRARTFAQRRNGRLSLEDLLFSIRHDQAVVSRLRIYLSWKELRKKAKEHEGVEEPDVETLEEPATDKTSRGHKKPVKLSWEITSIFSEHLKEDSDDEDEDEIAAYEDSKQRLKEADEHTRGMSREEYQHYSECRQASFTYRKAKRFREFVGSAAFIEATVSDEVIGVLGFLSYDLVRTLCDGAMTSKRATELSIAKKAIQSRSEGRKKEATAAESEGVDDGKRPREEEDVAMEESEGTAGESKEKSTSTSTKPPKKLKKALSSTSIARVVSPATPRHQLVEPTSLFSLPPVNSPSDANSPHLVAPGSSLASDSITTKGKGMSLEELVHGISVNSDSARVSIRSGMKNWRSGARRPRV